MIKRSQVKSTDQRSSSDEKEDQQHQITGYINRSKVRLTGRKIYSYLYGDGKHLDKVGFPGT